LGRLGPMVRRRLLGWVPVAVLALCAGTACKGGKGGASDLAKQCEQLGTACGAEQKHQQKILDECKQGVDKLAEKGCADETAAAYACYQKELCGKGDPVWTIEDLRVLAERHDKCTTERNAVRDCVTK
jgi:hypothetical protein